MKPMELVQFTDEVDGRVVSSLWLYTVSLPSRYLAVIEEVQTLEQYRNEGRARRLIEKAIAHCKTLGIDCIELTVRQDRREIQAFYKSLGFEDRLNHAYRLRLL